jgi:hypothetical protein
MHRTLLHVIDQVRSLELCGCGRPGRYETGLNFSKFLQKKKLCGCSVEGQFGAVRQGEADRVQCHEIGRQAAGGTALVLRAVGRKALLKEAVGREAFDARRRWVRGLPLRGPTTTTPQWR